MAQADDASKRSRRGGTSRPTTRDNDFEHRPTTPTCTNPNIRPIIHNSFIFREIYRNFSLGGANRGQNGHDFAIRHVCVANPLHGKMMNICSIKEKETRGETGNLNAAVTRGRCRRSTKDPCKTARKSPPKAVARAGALRRQRTLNNRKTRGQKLGGGVFNSPISATVISDFARMTRLRYGFVFL
ncbi:hypothetical protein [Xiamenia xianingshaonis]|uniref:Uncharacterized protein n=1 Tax=Xiamenia xianingshaonis TaxID=2682776 RepID=A0ABX0IHI4_9ACTN|nr:hypothetical protein [Xiamenia xianingshaonis]NHM13497.1 hypothetical protein [Xiamenia xianingshaonis]